MTQPPTMSAENQWFGDMMILQVLADSPQVNDQEREVLTRWLAAASVPSQPYSARNFKIEAVPFDLGAA